MKMSESTERHRVNKQPKFFQEMSVSTIYGAARYIKKRLAEKVSTTRGLENMRRLKDKKGAKRKVEFFELETIC